MVMLLQMGQALYRMANEGSSKAFMDHMTLQFEKGLIPLDQYMPAMRMALGQLPAPPVVQPRAAPGGQPMGFSSAALPPIM